MSKVIRARYEGGVLKPLEPIELEEGEEVIMTVERDIRAVIPKHKGILGKADLEELLQLEEKAHTQ